MTTGIAFKIDKTDDSFYILYSQIQTTHKSIPKTQWPIASSR